MQISVTMYPEFLYGARSVLDKLFKKDAPASLPTETAPPAHAVTPDEMQAWQSKLTAAANDTSLLELLHQVPTTELKLAAIEALTEENSLKQVMHDFREHDKRLYRAAKSRWQTANDKRLATDQAGTLIANARALLEQAIVPVNR